MDSSAIERAENTHTRDLSQGEFPGSLTFVDETICGT
jgi:hypothetical protein